MTLLAALALLLGWVGLSMAGHAFAHRLLQPPAFTAWDRAVGASLATVLVPTGLVGGLAAVGAASRVPVVIATVAIVVLGLAASGPAARRASRVEIGRAVAAARAHGVGLPAVGVALALTAFALAAWASALLDPWAWDALGYHLPIVREIVATGRNGAVPGHEAYVNTYPRAVELFTVWWSLLTPTDALVELAQAPFAVLGAVAIGAWARRLGASTGRAVLFAAVFVALPIVCLQMATNYVDIAFASLFLAGTYLAFGEASWPSVLLAAFTFAAYVATKPSGPASFAIVFLALVFQARTRLRAERTRLVALAFVVVALGMGRYVENFISYGNPIWPVTVTLGPLTLPGTERMGDLVVAGMAEPVRALSPLGRIVASWTTVFAPYAYDMRLGGFGPAFAFVLAPATLIAVARVRRVDARGWVALVALAPLATPGSFWARYTLAFAGALLAIVAGSTETLPRGARRAIDGALCVCAALGLWLAAPGLTGNGPSLWAMARRTPEQRAAELSVDGYGPQWADARGRVKPGGALGYDLSVNLVGQLWPTAPASRALFRPTAHTLDNDFERWVRDERVDVVVLGNGTAEASLARSSPQSFRPLFPCPLDDCTVFEVARESVTDTVPGRTGRATGGSDASRYANDDLDRLEARPYPRARARDYGVSARDDR